MANEHSHDDEVAQAWAAEIQQRVAAVRAGELESTDWRTVLDRVERATAPSKMRGAKRAGRPPS